MAISWVSALKLVPWGDVIQAAPTVLKAAKGLMKKSPEQELEDAAQAAFPASAESQTPAANAGELALQKVEAAQRASNQVLEKMAEQQAQIVKTVGLLRTGATRLAWACGILSVAVIGLLVYSF